MIDTKSHFWNLVLRSPLGALSHWCNTLRHLGAHYWLAKTNYNYGIIAEIGGWHTIDELKKSYGQIPPEKILEIIK